MRFCRSVPLILFILLASCKEFKPLQQEIRVESDIVGKRVTTVSGTCYDLALTPRTDITKMWFKTSSDCIEALQRGMVDVYVDDEDIFTREDISRLGLKIAFEGDMDLPTAFGFRKSNPRLKDDFNIFLASLRRDGSLERIIDFWRASDGVVVSEIPEIPTYSEGVPLRVGTSLLMAPNSYILNGEWVGMEVEIVKRFAARLRRPVEISHFDMPSLIIGLQNGTLDIMMGSITVTEERSRNIDFSVPYVIKHPAFYVCDPLAKVHGMSFSERVHDIFYQNLIHDSRWKYLVFGLAVTLQISIASILLGSLLGILLCCMAFSRRRWMNRFVSLYVLLMRGLPMLVLLLFMFYVVFSGTAVNAIVVAITAFSINFAAGASGTFRNAIESVPSGQTEAGLALGFTKFKTFWYIVLPQAVRKGIGSFKGNCVGLIKNTSIVGYIAVCDLTKASDMIRNRTFDAFVPLIVISVVYLILAWAVGKLLDLTVKKR